MIRAFQPADAGQVMEIWLEGNADAHPFVDPGYWHSHAAEVRGQLLEAEVLVCEEEGAIVGVVGVQGDFIAGIFVRRGARGRDIGKRLLDAVKANHPSLTLSVYRKNSRAAAFYAREGFAVVSESIDPETGEAEQTLRWQ